ncbi:immunoglobulin-like domain-containing protein [Trueperella sp. LYQ143]|uniref:immunoglobulin-like domain-containing protein n=1 Tax=Trueperella sp. LYQ143 TaxID=3391059 RepID=UPI003983A7C6
MRKLRTIGAVFGASVVSLSAMAALPHVAFAQTDIPEPSAHYDMSREGGVLKDVSGHGYDAKLVDVPDSAFSTYSGGNAMTLAANGYAVLPQGPVTATDNDFTVEFTVGKVANANHFAWVIGDGVGQWNTTKLGNHVFVNPLARDWNGEILSGIRVKTDGGNGEIRVKRNGVSMPSGEFSTITMTSHADTIRLYLNGKEFTTATHPYQMSSIIPSGQVMGYLGRSLYEPDALFSGTYLDVKFWDQTLTPEQVAASVKPESDRKAAYNEMFMPADFDQQIRKALLGENTSADQITHNLTPPASVAGFDLTWASSDPAVIAVDGTITRPTDVDKKVTMTATDSSGKTYAYELTVPAISNASRAQADADALRISAVTYENLPLVTTGSQFGSKIAWSSSAPEVVTPTDGTYVAPAVGSADPFQGGGRVVRPAYGSGDTTVTVTATVTNGSESVTKSYNVVVKEKSRKVPDAGYAAAYFKADNNERIYMDYTKENNFFTFTPANEGKPVIVSTTDDKGLRDPYILRSVNGDRYYMVATDLCVQCGGYDWGRYQQWGSLKIHVWESTDLVHWNRTTDHDGALTINQPAAGMTWAPEAYWDDELQSYVVHFASRLYEDAAHTRTDGKARMFYVLTRDFKTFTYPPTEWQNTAGARIDSTVIKVDDMYYRFTKAEAGDTNIPRKDIILERSKVLTSKTTTPDPNTNPATGWQLLDAEMTRPKTGNDGEGPQVIKLNAGDPQNVSGNDYLLLVDNYGAGGYRAFRMSGEQLTSSSWENRLSRQDFWKVLPSKGLPESPRHGAFVSVPGTVLTAIAHQSDIAPVASTTSATADGRDVKIAVTAADGGEVVGKVHVTFTPEGSDQVQDLGDVTLVNGEAAITIPGNAAGKVVVAYTGYTDGLVSPSNTTVEVAKGSDPEPTPTPDPEPTPNPVPNPDPTPQPQPTPEPTPVPQPVPTPQPQPSPAPQPVTPQPTPPAPSPTPGLVHTGLASGGIAAMSVLLVCGGALLVRRSRAYK